MLKALEAKRVRGLAEWSGSRGGLILATRLLSEALSKIPLIPVLSNADEEVAGVLVRYSKPCSSKA